MLNEPVIRYSAPGRYDVAPGGTICKVMGDGSDYTLFVQLSESSEAPHWEPVGNLLEKAFGQFLNNQDFISRCLHLSSPTGDRCEHLKAISEIITQMSPH
jgi:hypothetical protein